MQNCISDEDPDQQATGLFNTQKKSPNSYSNMLSKSGHYPLISKTFSSISITNNTLPHPQCLTPVSWPSSCSICRQAYTSSRRKLSHYVNKYRIRALPSSTAAAAAPFSSFFFFYSFSSCLSLLKWLQAAEPPHNSWEQMPLHLLVSSPWPDIRSLYQRTG